MEYGRIKIPYIDKGEIKKQADLFREKVCGNTVPVNIEKAISVNLGMDISLASGLQSLTGVDALIASNWENIYVDHDEFLDDRYENRFRFSLAHEIGHYILHKKIYEQFGIESIDDFYRFIEEIPKIQYDYAESQANKFANYLLVPRERLLKEWNKILKSDLVFKKMGLDALVSYFSIPLSTVFGVSESVIEIAVSDLFHSEECFDREI